MKNEWTVQTPEELQVLAREILLHRSTGDGLPLVIALRGDLGAGKTAFTQELGKVLGVTEQIVSPTFTVMKSYALEHPDFDHLVHIDAYRIEDISEAGPLHLQELFQTTRTIICLEWPEKITEILPKKRVQVAIEIGSGEERRVTITLKK